ncbi:MAG: hypothetical protein Ct9H300mP25_00520 [Acidobacteriota bacterium]|nr:MAG: hypothetical protein Ct9H300mP25_00520 [Acidobacteriota bacterium]
MHRRFPHDTTAYTQGLILFQGKLLESTGRYGQSDLRRLDPATGTVEQRVGISPAFFGEGIARVDDRLIMLTYKAQRAFAFWGLNSLISWKHFVTAARDGGCVMTAAD